MDVKNNIRVFGSFKKIVDALFAMITVIRVIAVGFMLLQVFLIITNNGKSFKDMGNIVLKFKS